MGLWKKLVGVPMTHIIMRHWLVKMDQINLSKEGSWRVETKAMGNEGIRKPLLNWQGIEMSVVLKHNMYVALNSPPRGLLHFLSDILQQ